MSDAPLPRANPSLHRTLWILLGLIVLGMVGLYVAQTWQKMLHASSPVLPAFGEVAPFRLTERSGRTVTNQDLQGKVWVADFIFTTCPGPCPLLSQKMELLEHALRKTDRVKLVSITVDPEVDTPAVLQKYAERYEADSDKWWFLTGSDIDIQALIEKSFRLPRSKNPDLDAPKFGRFMHSTRFVLVDGHGADPGFLRQSRSGK